MYLENEELLKATILLSILIEGIWMTHNSEKSKLDTFGLEYILYF